MKATTIGRRLSRVGLAFAALVSIAAMNAPAEAKDWNHRHHRHKHHHRFLFGFTAPACYYTQYGYYYCPQRRHYRLPTYYGPPGHYAPAPSFQIIVPFGRRD